ncbi:hypothetical protein Tco_1379132 [Tanacetum coccineum]
MAKRSLGLLRKDGRKWVGLGSEMGRFTTQASCNNSTKTQPYFLYCFLRGWILREIRLILCGNVAAEIQQLYRRMVKLPVMVDFAQGSKLGAWLRACTPLGCRLPSWKRFGNGKLLETAGNKPKTFLRIGKRLCGMEMAANFHEFWSFWMRSGGDKDRAGPSGGRAKDFVSYEL